MSIKYNVYRDGKLIVSGLDKKTYTDTGLDADTEYEYQVSATNKGGETNLSENIVVKTEGVLINSREALIDAINTVDSGSVIELEGDFDIDATISINKDITIDGGGHVIRNTADDTSLFAVNGGNVNFRNFDFELSGENSRAFILNNEAGDFDLQKTSITGVNHDSPDGQRGISSNSGYQGNISIRESLFGGLRTGIYVINNGGLDINQTTFDGNYRGITIESSVVPSLTGNIFTNNDGDISVPEDSEIKELIEAEVEEADNSNTFDDDTPKYNW